MKIQRFLQKKIEKNLFRGKIIILYGPRQVGKTTLVKSILEKYSETGIYLDCQTQSVQNIFSEVNPDKIISAFGNKKLVVLDEAQSIENIGLKLKATFDKYPEIQIIATGSSSFDLANKINEPLTGRSLEYNLWPLSIFEILQTKGLVDYKNLESNIFKLGLYPFVNSHINDFEFAKQNLENIQTNYLYKDVLFLEKLNKPELLEKLLKVLAFRVGSELSYNSLANELDTSIHTVEKYLYLLEKVFIIKRLNTFSVNQEKSLRSKFKIYFIDIGIRNALIQNYNDLSLRDDVGKIFENFCIIERVKYNMYKENNNSKNYYFWRNYAGNEIDLIENYDDKLQMFEFKFSEKVKVKTEKLLEIFKKDLKYINKENVVLDIVNKENYLEKLNTN